MPHCSYQLFLKVEHLHIGLAASSSASHSTVVARTGCSPILAVPRCVFHMDPHMPPPLWFLQMTQREVEVISISRDTTESDLKQRREIHRSTVKYSDQPVVQVSCGPGSAVPLHEVLSLCELTHRLGLSRLSHRIVSDAHLDVATDRATSPHSSSNEDSTLSVFGQAALNGRVLLLEGLEKAERNLLPVLNNLLENREMPLEDGRFIISANRCGYTCRAGPNTEHSYMPLQVGSLPQKFAPSPC